MEAIPGRPRLLYQDYDFALGAAIFVKVACLSEDGRINYVVYFHRQPEDGTMKTGQKFPRNGRGEEPDIPYPIFLKMLRLAGAKIRPKKREGPRSTRKTTPPPAIPPKPIKYTQTDLFEPPT